VRGVRGPSAVRAGRGTAWPAGAAATRWTPGGLRLRQPGRPLGLEERAARPPCLTAGAARQRLPRSRRTGEPAACKRRDRNHPSQPDVWMSSTRTRRHGWAEQWTHRSGGRWSAWTTKRWRPTRRQRSAIEPAEKPTARSAATTLPKLDLWRRTADGRVRAADSEKGRPDRQRQVNKRPDHMISADESEQATRIVARRQPAPAGHGHHRRWNHAVRSGGG
jgi:hypothetical protein